MKPQTVYIPTKDLTEFERPLIDSLDNFIYKKEAFVFTPEELKQLIKKAVDNTIDAYHYYVESPHNPPPMNGNDYFENFLNKEK